MKLKFTGFPGGWRRGEDAFVDGYGSIKPGEARDYPEDVSLFLLATRIFAEETDESVEAPTEAPTETPTETPVQDESTEDLSAISAVSMTEAPVTQQVSL